ncbi:MAG: hypothetical protein HOV87_03620 [Catenulispora sp.]|nr:hypothetical protein [Catenulispora sp.]
MIARNPEIRLRDIALAADITERTAQNIVADLEQAGYLTRTRQGRRNKYVITPGTRFRHRAEADHEVAELLSMIVGPSVMSADVHREFDDQGDRNDQGDRDNAARAHAGAGVH